MLRASRIPRGVRGPANPRGLDGGGGQRVGVRGSSLSPPISDGLSVSHSPEFARLLGLSEIYELLLQSKESSDYDIRNICE